VDEARTGVQKARGVPPPLEAVFEAGGHTLYLLGSGPVDSAPSEGDPAEAAEARPNEPSGAKRSGTPRVDCSARSPLQRSIVVGVHPRRHAYSSAGITLRTARSTATVRTNLNSLNRRMRTRELARMEPACPMVWEGDSRDLRLPPIPMRNQSCYAVRERGLTLPRAPRSPSRGA
jgi:hypothetical protein